MKDYFERFTRHFLVNDSTDVADVEVVGREIGDQLSATGAHLTGITYDPRTQALELELEDGDLRSYSPKEVWTLEEDDGFIRAIEIVRGDDTTEIVHVRRLGVQRAD
jgi:hypothetical protein